MKAKKVFENINFERSQDPKRSMRVGIRYNSLMRIAFDDPENIVRDKESFGEWLDENPLLKNKLADPPYQKNENIYCFDVDYYTEQNNIDSDDFGFIPTKPMEDDPEPGSVSIREGKIKDGSKVLYYRGGMTDGYITRDSWLK